MHGISSVTDSPRPGQARWLEAITAVEAIVKENRRVTVNEVAVHMGKSDGSAHHIVHDILQFHKVSARWVPRQLTAELKERRVDARQELLRRFEAEGGLLSRKNCYGRWNLGPLPPAGNQESERGMAPYLFTKNEKIPRATICGKGYADSLLG